MRKISRLFFSLAITLILLPGVVNASSEKEVIILHTNDVHSRVDDNDREIGYAKFKGYINTLESGEPIILDAGDALHGKVISTSCKGETIVDIMNMVGYTAMSPGNHDFNYGIDRLRELSKRAEFKVLTANVVDLDGNYVFTPYIIEERDGVKIGIFGLCTPETAIKTKPSNVHDIIFEECINVSQDMVDKLNSEGVDAIVCVGHIGLDVSSVITSDVICANVDGIDVFVDGHSHSELKDGIRVNQSLIVSTGQYLNNIGKVTMTFDEYNVLQNVKCELVEKSSIKDIEPDSEVLNFIQEIRDKQMDEFGKVIIHTDIDLNGVRNSVRTGSTNLSRMLADAIYKATYSDVSILNGGTIRDSIKKGDVTMLNIIEVLPFENVVVTKEITGQQLKNMLEEGVGYYPIESGGFSELGGMTYKFDPQKQKGDRVISIQKDGEEISMDGRYIVAFSDYLEQGGDNYPYIESPIINQYESIAEIFIEYLKNNPVLQEGNDIMKEANIVLVPLTDLIIYRVNDGDILEYIAREYGSDVYDIAKVNGLDLENPQIYESELLFIPKTL